MVLGAFQSGTHLSFTLAVSALTPAGRLPKNTSDVWVGSYCFGEEGRVSAKNGNATIHMEGIAVILIDESEASRSVEQEVTVEERSDPEGEMRPYRQGDHRVKAES